MASPAGSYGNPASAAALLLDPKAMKKQMANGTSISPHPNSSFFQPRQSSEPPLSYSSHFSPFSSITSDPFILRAKDDAYAIFASKGNRAGNAQKIVQTPSNRFDPRRLLDPAGFDKVAAETKTKERSEPELNSSNHLSSDHVVPAQIAGDTAHKREYDHADENEGQGVGSLYERIHNVSQREERPQKKQKTTDFEDDHDDKKAINGGGGRGGEIGEYLKEKKKEGMAESGPANAVVDLTGGLLLPPLQELHTDVDTGDDEDVVLVSDSQEKEVCYGRLGDTKVNAHMLPTPSGKAMFMSKAQWPPMKLQLRRHPGKDSIIRVIDPQGKDFGNVDVRTSIGLSKIMDSRHPKFRTQARLNARNRKKDEYPGKDCSEFMDMTVNLYGPKSKAATMGRFLSQRNYWLRQPFMVDSGIEVVNPHQPTIAPPRTTTGSRYGMSGTGSTTAYVTRTTEEVRNDVIGMFDNLQQSEQLPEMDSDPRVITELLSHQRQGLYFLTNKEKARVFGEQEEANNSLWRIKYHPDGRTTYYNVITGQEERTQPPEVLGGILADMMGLGKTLSMLALIVGSLADANRWASQDCPEMDGEKALIRNSKTTLLVSPLSTVANWEDQIATHIKPKTLKYYIYHGGNRISDIDDLAEFDVVITTYSIVSSEFSGRGKRKDINPLLQTNFFRIILDEAHMIREQATRQSQAICTLSAERRWAVTVCFSAFPQTKIILY